MALTTTIELAIRAARSQALDRGSVRDDHVVELPRLVWPSGTSESQADTVWSDRRTVNAAAHDNLDLTSLAQLDSAGATVRTVAFAVVKLILILNRSTSGYLAVGGGTDGAAAADAWALTLAPFAADAAIAHVPFGGGWMWFDPTGVAVTNSSADILHLGGISANQTYDIIIIGET